MGANNIVAQLDRSSTGAGRGLLAGMTNAGANAGQLGTRDARGTLGFGHRILYAA